MSYANHYNYVLVSSTVELSGTDNNEDFRGFLIQGRLAADGSTPAGTFLIGNSDTNQQALCTGNVSSQNWLYSYLLAS